LRLIQTRYFDDIISTILRSIFELKLAYYRNLYKNRIKMAKMNSPWKTNQRKYVLKRVSSLLTEIRLITICDDIYTTFSIQALSALYDHRKSKKNWKLSRKTLLQLLRGSLSFSKFVFEIYLTSYKHVYEIRFFGFTKNVNVNLKLSFKNFV
jgi:hypothetical protein